MIPDGLYFVFPDGSGWECYIYRDGRCVGGTDEATQATHDTARDSLAGIWPRETDEIVDDDLADAIVRDTRGYGVDMTAFAVSKQADRSR